MNAATRKALNTLLADALRAQGLPRNGATWAQAKALRDDLIAEGTRAKSACNKAAWRVMRAEDNAREVLATVPEQAPVTQAPTQEAKALPAQAKRVQEGKVMRDSRGRILPTHVQEAFAELAAL